MTTANADTLRAILDLSFCLALVREGAAGIEMGPLMAALQGYAPGEVGIAAPTVADLLQRAATSSEPERNRNALEQFLLPLVSAPFDAPAALHLATLRLLQPEAAASEPAFAAATALALDAVLLTCTPQAYAAIAGLRVQGFAPAAHPHLPAPRSGSLILAMGSHDPTLELVGDHLHATQPDVLFCSAHVGSLAGLHAILRGDAHLAGVHLLDDRTGLYNEPALRALFEPLGRHAVLIGFVQRVQGLVVAQGNPHNLRTTGDAVVRGIRIVNRQRGSGTRVLLDRELRLLGVEPATVRGYGDEEQSHSAVAAVVASGRADCGLGIEAGARARGLDFVPLFKERYDLAIPVEHYASARLAP
ncbi:MAG: substrate-binding domain-containing protein, partial [Caldilineaceae bacterium]